MRKLIAFLTYLVATVPVFAQPANLEFEVSADQIKDGYIIRKVWLQHYQQPTVEVLHARYSEVPGLPDSVQLKPAKDLDIILGMERKRPFAFIRIPAYNLAPATRQPAQLSFISLKLTEAAAQPQSDIKAKTTASPSVLAQGNWYKISVKERGVYKIDYSFLQSKLGIDPNQINPSHIRLYGNGGTLLPENNAAFRYDDLQENAIVVVDGGDNKFDANDYILFYANGPHAWEKNESSRRFHYQHNIYEDNAYYFLNFDQGPGKRVQSASVNDPADVVSTSTDAYQAHNNDLVNLRNFGKLWWGEEFSTDPGGQNSRSFSFDLGSATDSMYVRYHIGSRSPAAGNLFAINLNGQQIVSRSFGQIPPNSEANAIANYLGDQKVAVNSNTAVFDLTYTPAASSGKGYLDFLELNYRTSLSFNGPQFFFSDWNTVGTFSIAEYRMANANSNIVVWDITNPLEPTKMNGNISGGNFIFKQAAGQFHEFIAHDGTSYHTPEFVHKVENQNLHGSNQVDYVIVTHKDFVDAAEKLADFHRQKNQLRVLVTTTDVIYNEFSSGSQDISAIRDFVKMFYDRAGNDTTEMPRYLLLLGDASFDYKDRVTNNTNFVPTYETSESVATLVAYCSDDFFGFLDQNENVEDWSIANTLDVAVGRLPVATATSAMKVVEKIIGYASPASLGPWRLSTTIVTDNGDGLVHFEDGEIMTQMITNQIYNPNKIHLAAIPTISTPGGVRAPEANKAINDAVFKGTFLINYNGHGSIITLAHERILTQDDFNGWKNINKLPIIVTATCEFSKYDEPAHVSAGEKLILKEDGGAIALLTTTQLVYQHLNRPMNMSYIRTQFNQVNGQWLTFGDAIRHSKNLTYVSPGNEFALANYRKFALLGDPALKPAFPEHKVSTDEVYAGDSNKPTDTLSALGKHTVKGSIRDNNDQVITDFNGTVYLTIYDKPKTRTTLPENGTQKTFTVQNNIIYRGKATVTNGRFSVTFITPKDINYDYGIGKISYYAENGLTDAAGIDSSMVIGGFSDNPVIEDDAPIVKPFMNDSLFIDGGLTGTNSLLYVQLFDETGINVSGNSVGHDLTAILDDQYEAPYILNDYYETAPDDCTRGYVSFPISGLPDGRHSLRVKAWDMNNNSGEGTVHFEVVNGEVVLVRNLMNYPNPFRDVTNFVFEHNHPEQQMNITIQIFNTMGGYVRTIKETFTPNGSRTNEISWDGTDDNGTMLPSGIYVYRVNITTDKGLQTSAYQKLVIVR